MTTFGEDLIQSLKEALAHTNGEGPAIVHAPVTPREVRERAKLTQSRMAPAARPGRLDGSSPRRPTPGSLLEEAEHRRLLEKWISEGLSDEERDRIPPELLDRVRAHFQERADAALEQVGDGDVSDGPTAMKRLRERIEAQS